MATDPTLPILIVDDLGSMVRILRRLLTGLGYRHIDDATCTDDALAKLRAGRYRLLICDGDMHTQNGCDLPARLRADAALRRIPVITIATGAVGEAPAAEGVIVVKPIDARTLAHRIAEALAAEGGSPRSRATRRPA